MTLLELAKATVEGYEYPGAVNLEGSKGIVGAVNWPYILGWLAQPMGNAVNSIMGGPAALSACHKTTSSVGARFKGCITPLTCALQASGGSWEQLGDQPPVMPMDSEYDKQARMKFATASMRGYGAFTAAMDAALRYTEAVYFGSGMSADFEAKIGPNILTIAESWRTMLAVLGWTADECADAPFVPVESKQ